MSKKIILIAFLAILTLGLFSQRPTMELTFTSVDSAAYQNFPNPMGLRTLPEQWRPGIRLQCSLPQGLLGY